MGNTQNKPQLAPLLLLLVTCVLAAPVLAGEPPAFRPIDSETTALNLTPAQQQKLTALENTSHAQSGQLIAQLQQLRRKLSDLYGMYDFDVNEARRINQDLNRVQGQLLDLRLTEQLQLRPLLTPDQFAQLQAAIHKRASPGGHRHHGADNGHDQAPDHRPGNFHP